MFGFPINLFDGGITPAKFTPDANSGFPKNQQIEIFYSVKDGSWNDRTTWETASGRVGLLPTRNDDVYIRNVVSMNNGFNANNIFISSVLNILDSSPQQNNIFGNIKCYGRLIIGQFQTLNIGGNDNFILNYTFSNTSVINYNGFIDQTILPIQYVSLFATNGRKYLNHNIVIGNIFSINNCGFYINTNSLIVNGESSIGTTNVATLYCLVDNANLLFNGLVTITNFSQGNAIDFSGNPNIEFRNGLFFNQPSAAPQIGITGTGTWSFTTNNQTLRCWGTGIYNCNILIGSGITLSILNTFGTNTLNKTINGIDSTSRLLMAATGNLYFNTLASVSSMTTGIWDFTTNANTIGYTGNYTATIPSYFPTFHNLTIGGTGTKSLGVNTTLNGALLIQSGGNLELSTFNFSVLGTTTLNSPNQNNKLSKSGSGNILFVGLVTLPNQPSTPGFDFSGNPNVEFRGGIIQTFVYSNVINSGTGIFSFTTNNQSINVGFSSQQLIFNCKIEIANNITLTNTSSILTLNDTINGITSTSKLLNLATINFNTLTSCSSMTTGIFDFTTIGNTIGFTGNYSVSINSLYNTFQNLNVAGTGIKSIQTNTTLNGNLTLTTNGNLELSTYNFIVNGNSNLSAINQGIKLSKSGAGNVLFVGNLSIANQTPLACIDFSGGNPSVELRNGISGLFIYSSVLKTGTGIWTFTTNNQSLNFTTAIAQPPTFNCPILIGPITLTINGTSSTNPFYFTNTINGNNVASKLMMGTNSPLLQYLNATRPMITGILDTSTNLNTFIYGSGNQDILGSPTISPKQVYRNLTLNGTGVKTLQGYVSVLNTYTLTAPATLANNGFTLTNP